MSDKTEERNRHLEACILSLQAAKQAQSEIDLDQESMNAFLIDSGYTDGVYTCIRTLISQWKERT